jgi:hypothetical protein
VPNVLFSASSKCGFAIVYVHEQVEPDELRLGQIEDSEARQLVEGMMFDQRQKELGLPTRKDIESAAMMKKFQEAMQRGDVDMGSPGPVYGDDDGDVPTTTIDLDGMMAGECGGGEGAAVAEDAGAAAEGAAAEGVAAEGVAASEGVAAEGVAASEGVSE